MPLGEDPQCAACKINHSLMWRKGTNGETLCNSCHLKRLTTNTRSQRQSSKESRKLVARLRAGSRKGHWNGKGGERSRERGRRTIQKMKTKVHVYPNYIFLRVVIGKNDKNIITWYIFDGQIACEIVCPR